MKTKTDIKNFSRWYLVAGILVFVLMTFTLAVISQNIRNHEPLTVVDAQLSNWLHARASPLLTRVMFVATSFGATLPVIIFSLALGFYLLRRRRFFWLATVVLTVPGGVLLNKLLKYAFHRPRPYFDDPLLNLTSYSFPSGHTMAATLLYGVAATFLFAQTSDRRLRALIIFCAGFLIALVGFSRIYLGAHYLSDVLGAMAEGFAWLSLCYTVVHSVWRKRNHQAAQR